MKNTIKLFILIFSIMYPYSSSYAAFTLISTQSGSTVSNLSWTGLSNGGFMLTCSQLVTTSAATQNVQIVIGTGATPTWQSSGYNYAFTTLSWSGTSSSINSTSASYIPLVPNASSNHSTIYGMTIFIQNFTNGGMNVQSFGNNSSLAYAIVGSSAYSGTFTAIRVQPLSGTISGSCSLYSIQQ